MKTICLVCKITFNALPAVLKKGHGKYCSLNCRNTTYAGAGNPKWRGGKFTDQDGYILVKNRSHPFADNRGYIREHRLVMEEKLGRYLKPTEHIDHVNRIKSDNRLVNLRLSTQSQNNMNKAKQSNNKLGYKGVFKTRNNTYQAQIHVNKKNLYLGIYKTPEDAARAYDEAAKKNFGEYACPNFV